MSTTATITLTVAASLAAMTGQIPGADGHAYVLLPVSRQYFYTKVFQEDDFPKLETCPQAYNALGQASVQERLIRLADPAVLEAYGDGWEPLRWVFDKGEMAENGNYLEPEGIAVRHGICGDPIQPCGNDQPNENANAYSTPNREWELLGDYEQGSVMEIKVLMSAYHWGHLEFFICDAKDLSDPGGVATQECMNKYPLTRAQGDDRSSPIDPSYPGRYYVDPPCRKEETDQTKDIRSPSGNGNVMTMNYQLPPDLTCTHCTLQMVYYTGHKCRLAGYEEFNPSSWPSECAPNKEDWIDTGVQYCGDERWLTAEIFWGCSDFAITGGGSGEPILSGSPAPTELTPATTSAPVDAPPESTPAPSNAAEVATPAPSEAESVEDTLAPLVSPSSAPMAYEDDDWYEDCDEGGDAECPDPVRAYGKCGGDETFSGSKCCIEGYECIERAACFSECRPVEL